MDKDSNPRYCPYFLNHGHCYQHRLCTIFAKKEAIKNHEANISKLLGEIAEIINKTDDNKTFREWKESKKKY